MSENEEQFTVFENEDLVFDLQSGKVRKISDRFKLHLSENLIAGISTISDFENLISSLAKKKITRSLDKKGDQVFKYTLDLQGAKFLVVEICWVNLKTRTLHSLMYFQKKQNIFTLPYQALTEIVEKMESPAILFDGELHRALVVNAATIPVLNQPFSELAAGFNIRDFFVFETQYNELFNWILNEGTPTYSLEAKLYLEKDEGAWFRLMLFKTCPEEEVLILCVLNNTSEKRETEEKLGRTNELLSRVVEVQSHFLSKSKGANPYDLLLSNILSVIDAKLGFVGKVDIGKEGKPVLRIHSATDISGDSEDAYNLFQKHVKDDFLFRHFDNLFGACIVESKIILENNPATNPHTKGKKIPGHPIIDNFLGVPIIKGSEVIGLIGLGNKKGGFTNQDITDLKPFITTYSVIIEAFKSEQEKIRFEKDSLVSTKILKEVADHSPDLIVVMNESFDFEFISSSAYQFFDVGMRVEQMERKIRALLKRAINSAFQISDKRYRSRLKLNIKNDGEYWVESNVNILNEESNQKVIAIIRDVSSQMDYEQRLVESLNKERQFNSFVSDFMNIVAHEFKTPLATIISSMELSKHYMDSLSDLPEVGKLKMHSEKIERELGNLHKLVLHSLDYDRFVNNSPILKKGKVFIAAFVKEVLQMHGLLSQVKFIPQIPADFSTQWDKFLIETSIVNLVSNALKYGAKIKKPIVRVFQHGATYGIEVEDFGVGIMEEELPYVFTPFFRGSNVNGIEGTGFGLVAVKNFVEMHGGTVKIDSKPNKGTSVRVSFRQ